MKMIGMNLVKIEFFLPKYFLLFLGDEWSAEPSNIIQETVPSESIPAEHHEEQENKVLDEPNSEPKESDTRKDIYFEKTRIRIK
jgi:hypothetical protein